MWPTFIGQLDSKKFIRDHHHHGRFIQDCINLTCRLVGLGIKIDIYITEYKHDAVQSTYPLICLEFHLGIKIIIVIEKTLSSPYHPRKSNFRAKAKLKANAQSNKVGRGYFASSSKVDNHAFKLI